MKDMMDIMLDVMDSPEENKEVKIDFDVILATFNGLVLAGIDTSSHVAGMAIYNLARNPEIKVNIQNF